eukprot:gene1009-biopygen19732
MRLQPGVHDACDREGLMHVPLPVLCPLHRFYVVIPPPPHPPVTVAWADQDVEPRPGATDLRKHMHFPGCFLDINEPNNKRRASKWTRRNDQVRFSMFWRHRRRWLAVPVPSAEISRKIVWCRQGRAGVLPLHCIEQNGNCIHVPHLILVAGRYVPVRTGWSGWPPPPSPPRRRLVFYYYSIPIIRGGRGCLPPGAGGDPLPPPFSGLKLPLMYGQALPAKVRSGAPGLARRLAAKSST